MYSNMQTGSYRRVSPPGSTRPSHWGGTPKPRVRACIGMVRSTKQPFPSSGRGGCTSVSSRSFRGALLNAGDSGVRTRNGIYNDVYDGGTHQIHGQTPQCGIRLWTPGIRASADALRGRDPRRLWLTVQRSGMVGIRGRGAAATGAQQENSRASPNRIPTRIWSSPSLPDLELSKPPRFGALQASPISSSPSLPDLELSKPPRFGAQGVPSIRTVEMNAEDLPVGRLLSIWSAQCGACVRAGAVKRSVPALWELRWELTWSRPL